MKIDVRRKGMFIKAPLPFVGQKNKFVDEFIKVLDEIVNVDGEGWIILDIFGGSGLCSHVAKHIKPQATVVYNDFDDYHKRLSNDNIDLLNEIRQKLHRIVVQENVQRDTKFDEVVDEKIRVVIREYLDKGFEPDLRTLVSWICFSGRQYSTYDEMLATTYWNRIPKIDLKYCNGYLKGLVIEKQDFRDLINRYQSLGSNILLILDPPYVNTNQDSYKGKLCGNGFNELLNLIKSNYILFSSDSSGFLEVLENTKDTRFKDFTIVEKNVTCSHNSGYSDIMVYKQL